MANSFKQKFQNRFSDIKAMIIYAFDFWFEILLPKIFFGMLLLAILNLIYLFIDPNSHYLTIVNNIESELQSLIFNEDKVGLLINISIVLIGFLITVMSVLGTNYSRAVLKMAEDDTSDRFIGYSTWSLFLAFSFLILSIINTNLVTPGETFIHFFLLCSLLSNAIRFSIIVIEIFRKNIDGSSEEVKKKDEKNAELISILSDIKDYLEEERFGDSNYYEKLKSEIKEREREEKG
ncbi:hypothetical protein [Halobacillus sp. A5]|uniref:hypothetical protein n=1 Tax=Halobacillus sp. A5 TaxID=2880263 RepID=UPI0020A6CAE5|nr:hypothetical protein [Halobacillus sp. A5]MCP3028812.1 hypothetical protein [Halobacillus sp. A5]